MNGRFVLLGVLFVAIGVLFILYPTTLVAPSHVSNRTVLVRVIPGNYSAVNAPLNATETLSVGITSSPQPVDFFLMNSSSYATWNSKGNPPTNIYPQYSKLNVTNYSFQVVGGDTAENFTLVFLSTSLSAPNNIEVQLTVDKQVGLLQANLVPIIIILCGVAVIAFGATRKGKVEEVPQEEKEEPSQGGGLMGLLGGGGSPPSGRKCRYCGADVEEGAVFCPSCHRSNP